MNTFRPRNAAIPLVWLGLVVGPINMSVAQTTGTQEAPSRVVAAASGKALPGGAPVVTADLLTKSAYRSGRTAQPKALLQKFIEGSHTCPADQAVAGVEVVNLTRAGASEIRHFDALLIRCDGFLLVPVASISRAMAGDHEADTQEIRVTLHPGTPLATQAAVFFNHFSDKTVPMVTIKLKETHVPAARTLMPDALKPGDEVQVVWTDWDEQAMRFGSLQRRTARLAEPPKGADEAKKADLRPGEIRFAEVLTGVPAGAVVVSSEGMAVGILPASAKRHDRFLGFSLLNKVTSCIVPAPTTDAEFARLQKRPDEGDDPPASPVETEAFPKVDPPVTAPGADDNGQGSGGPGKKHAVNEMVTVPGGPIKMPNLLLDLHGEMLSDVVACVSEFKIDRYKVSNQEYYAFWKSLPAKERNKPQVRAALYPIAWAITDPPFPEEVADTPVLGVPLSGAQAYARSQGKRLPTVYEWCRAAFGPLGDGAVPEWAFHFMLDRQTAWQRLVLMHIETLVPILQDEADRTRIQGDIDQTIKSTRIVGPSRTPGHLTVGDWVKLLNGPAASSRLQTSPTIPFITIYERYRQMQIWSKQVVEAEAKRLCETWVDPLYVLPAGSRSFDVSPFGVADMLLNGNEQIAAAPEQYGNPETIQIRWDTGFADPKWLAGLGNTQLESFYTRIFSGRSPDLPHPFLSRRLVAASALVQPDSRDFCPSYHQKFVELYSRLEDLAEIIRPINELVVQPQSGDMFQTPPLHEEYGETGTQSTDMQAAITNLTVSGPVAVLVRYPWKPISDIPTSSPPYCNPFNQHEGEEPRLDERYGLFRGIYFNETPWYPLWEGTSPFQRREMGRDTAQDPPVRIGAPPRADGRLNIPGEIYLVPNGFRCAR